ncbi:hypothetical protein IW261DRAFT_3436 [Armillaria novae-zelandiae]|uniref:Uncharacterized protein n=1 Tax=Armillaria novae-zelandiae TaxID=153914 RepID=A0AA39PW81_9AGAR|nr:hypothetical protein IW261DRAFT_3436 [Armillaria novae-zelandiae]
MAIHTAIPPDLTDEDKLAAFQYLDSNLNVGILYALSYGLYTGILAVTLWSIFTNKCWQIRRAIAIVIILIHVLITFNFAANISYIRSAFIENGQTFWTVFLKLQVDGAGQASFWEGCISASLSTLLTDLYMIWCCWMVWEQRWYIGLFLMSTLVSAIVSRIVQTYYTVNTQALARIDLFTRLYLSLNLATTLSCTLLIIYRITIVVGFRRGTGGRFKVYRHFIGVLVESSALYSMALILDLALWIHQYDSFYYFDAISAIAKGVAPTLLVGRAAAGHTQPNDNSDESTVSALHFRMASSEPVIASLQGSAMQRTVLETDVEAQLGQSDELVVVVERNATSLTKNN